MGANPVIQGRLVVVVVVVVAVMVEGREGRAAFVADCG